MCRAWNTQPGFKLTSVNISTEDFLMKACFTMSVGSEPTHQDVTLCVGFEEVMQALVAGERC